VGKLLRIPEVRRIFFALFGLEACLVLLHLAFAVRQPSFSFHLERLTSLRAEQNWPTWFSTIQLAAIGTIAFALAGEAASSLARGGWRFAGLFFFFLSMDEACLFHERVGRFFDQNFGPEGAHVLPGGLGAAVEALSSRGIYPWTIVMGPPLLLAGLLLLLGLSQGLRPVPGAFSTAFLGIVLMAGSQAFEFLEGVAVARDARLTTEVFVVVEEFLEMFGATAVLTAFYARRKLVSAASPTTETIPVFDAAQTATPITPASLAGYRRQVRRYGMPSR